MDNSFAGNLVGTLVIFLIICFIIFLICREIVCWYFKINQMVGLLKEIRDLLAKRDNSNVVRPVQEVTEVNRCPSCNEVNSSDTQFCTSCGRSLKLGTAPSL